MPESIASTARLLGEVFLGEGTAVEDFVVIGTLPNVVEGFEPRVAIGPNATIRSHSVIYAGNTIGARFQTGHGALLREANEIADDVSVGSHSIVEHRVRIGRGARIHSNAFVPEFSVIDEGAWIGPCVVLTNARYPTSPNAKRELAGVHVGARARVGAGAVLLPGITIGADALVGAGAVVVRDVPAGTVVVGNPARVIGDVADIPAYQEASPAS